MTNFFRNYAHTLKFTFIALVAGLFLQGCGAERTTPFNSISSNSSCSSNSSSSSSSSYNSSSSSKSSSSCSSSSSSLGASIDVEPVYSNKAITHGTPKNKNVQIIQTDEDYQKIVSGQYAQYSDLPLKDLTTGQIVLISDGENNGCETHVEFNKNISANQMGENAVLVKVNYNMKPQTNGCSPSSPSTSFSIYYIPTKKILVIQEVIN